MAKLLALELLNKMYTLLNKRLCSVEDIVQQYPVSCYFLLILTRFKYEFHDSQDRSVFFHKSGGLDLKVEVYVGFNLSFSLVSRHVTDYYCFVIFSWVLALRITDICPKK